MPETDMPRIVVIGGGFAGLSFIEGMRKKSVQVVLLDKNNHHQFQPLLYQVATSGLESDSVAFPFRKQITGYRNVIFCFAEVMEIDPRNKTVHTDRGRLIYDFLVIATGTKTNYYGLKKVKHNSIGLKTIRDSLDIKHKMLQNLEQATITCINDEKESLTNFVIVRGGPAGVEMAGALV